MVVQQKNGQEVQLQLCSVYDSLNIIELSNQQIAAADLELNKSNNDIKSLSQEGRFHLRMVVECFGRPIKVAIIKACRTEK